MFKAKFGFSILEIILVVAIVAVMASYFYVATKPTKRLGEAADLQRAYDVEAIEKAIKLVATDSGSLAAALTGLTDGVPYMLVRAGASTVGTYACTATGTSIAKADISTAIASIMPSLPVDPDLAEASNDTGYYLVKNGNSYNIESCDTYELDATIGDKQQCGDGYCGSTESCSTCTMDCGACVPSAVCGNGILEGAEVCDDGDLVNEGCGNGFVEVAGSSYCNSTCSASITISISEVCDYTGGQCGVALPDYPHTSPIGCNKKPLCSDDCDACIDFCPSE